jgi:ABC-2 type transport system ATP-binding protein
LELGLVIEARGLTKRYGSTVAVDRLSFVVRPGVVTGFLGPNGAGKSTTMRLILGLDAPTSGTVTVNGRSYRDHRFPLFEVGALLDAMAVHPARTGRAHLLALARSNGLGKKRVGEVLDQVGLTAAANRRAGTYSLGMKQRLGIAAALLGDPEILLFDEPVTGLDPEGIVWIRTLFHALAAEGRTVFVSSHLMSEMAQTAQHLLVIGRGRLIADASLAEVLARGTSSVRVRSPRSAELAELISRAGGTVGIDDGSLAVTGLDAPAIGELAAGAGIALHELAPQQASLEEAFFELTDESVEYHGATSLEVAS